MVAPAVLSLALLVELAALVAAGVVGASLGSPPFGLAGAIAGVGLFAVVWGLFFAPRSRFPQSATFRLVGGSLVMEATAFGLIVVGNVAAGVILAILVFAVAGAVAATGATAGSLEREAPQR
ncbi:MAG: DUF2568 domain-containing protein [Candidatus Limnocylindrales bacterium]